MAIIFNGEPGTRWVNDTGVARYQFFCNWSNTCGVCAQYDRAIGSIWPIPIHPRCACFQRLVLPGGVSEPFVDFREIAESLPFDQQKKLVGAWNWRLLSHGLVEWSDVVTKTRVRLFREVAARAGLSDETLRGLGVTSRRLEFVASARGLGEGVLEAAQRAELSARLESIVFRPEPPGGALVASSEPPVPQPPSAPLIGREDAAGLRAFLRRSLSVASRINPFEAMNALGATVAKMVAARRAREKAEEEKRRRERR